MADPMEKPKLDILEEMKEIFKIHHDNHHLMFYDESVDLGPKLKHFCCHEGCEEKIEDLAERIKNRPTDDEAEEVYNMFISLGLSLWEPCPDLN